MKLRALYVASDTDTPKNVDDLLSWILSSPDYWAILAQYGVAYGAVVGSDTIPLATFMQPDDVQAGFVGAGVLAYRIQQAIAALPVEDGGAPDLPGEVSSLECHHDHCGQ